MHYPLSPADVSLTAAGRTLLQGQGSSSIGGAATISMGDVLTIDTMYAAATVGLNRETDLTIQVGETLSGNTADNGVHFFGNPAPDVTHRFVVPAAGGKYQFSTCGSAFDTYLRVFNAEWVEIDQDDDSGPCGVQTVLRHRQPRGRHLLAGGRRLQHRLGGLQPDHGRRHDELGLGLSARRSERQRAGVWLRLRGRRLQLQRHGAVWCRQHVDRQAVCRRHRLQQRGFWRSYPWHSPGSPAPAAPTTPRPA